jgi:hypothetical protein
VRVLEPSSGSAERREGKGREKGKEGSSRRRPKGAKEELT